MQDITNSNSSALPNILLGVTNPFFTKALDHWPHIVKLGGGTLSDSGAGAVNGGGSSPKGGVKAGLKGHSPFKQVWSLGWAERTLKC